MQKIFSLVFFLIAVLCILLGFSHLKEKGVTKTNLIEEFSQNDPTLIQYKKYLKHFNPQNEISLLIQNKKNEDINFNSKEINIFVQNIKNDPSIKNVIYYSDLKPFFEDSKITFFNQFFLSLDKKSFILYLTLHDLSDREKQFFIKELLGKINKSFNEHSVHMLGVEYFRYSIYESVLKNYTLLLPIMAGVIFLIFLLFFRNYKLVLIALFTLAFCFLATGAVIFLIRGALSPFSSFSLLFVFIICTSDLAHLFGHTLAIAHKEKTDFSYALIKAKKIVYLPCFLTSLTTVIGLFALIFSEFQTLFYFGIGGIAGVIIGFITCFHLLPEMIMLIKPTIIGQSMGKSFSFMLGLKKSKSIVLVGFVFLILTSLSLKNIPFEDDFYNKFTSHHPFSKSVNAYQSAFSRISYIDLFGAEEKFLSQDFINAQKDILDFSDTKMILSLSDFYLELKSLYPTSYEQKYIQFKATPLADTFISKTDQRFQRSLIYFSNLDAKNLLDVQEKIKTILNKHNLTDIEISGFTLLRSRFVELLEKNYSQALMISLILIFFVFLFYLKNLKLSVIAMLTNLIAPLSVIYFIKLFGFKADMNLPLACTLALSVAVDDTIHFFYFYKKNNQDIESTLADISTPLTLSTLLLVATLLVLVLGDILLFTQFSILISIALILALIYDLFFLPALLKLLNKNDS